MQFLWSAQQIQGGRSYQEDFFAVVENNTVFYQGKKNPVPKDLLPAHQVLYVLADGMGGMGHGDIAASFVVENFIVHFLQHLSFGNSTTEKLHLALHQVNADLAELVRENPQYHGMGCTFVALLWDAEAQTIQWLSVGDSPLWLFRDGYLTRLNAIHTWGEMFRAGVWPTHSVRLANLEHMLISAVDGSELVHIDIPQQPYPLLAGDLLLLASDGMETLTCEQIEEQLSLFHAALAQQYPHHTLATFLHQQCAALIAAVEAQASPYQDNTSLILSLPIL